MANTNGEDVETYGPWGGEGGRPWDDGSHKHVKAITITFDPPGLPPGLDHSHYSVQSKWITLHRAARLLRAPNMEDTANAPKRLNSILHAMCWQKSFEFNPPDIPLAKMSGFVCGSVRKLTFETRSYPPYNKGEGIPAIPFCEIFQSPPDKEIVGFFGRSTHDSAIGHIEAIGIYAIPQFYINDKANEEPKL
eukprot:Gb_38774 [translate_table: standard]